jgi:2,3-bisphosphoglycerate-independent phosphoglycerate mutase
MAANCVLLRDAGDHLPRVESFQERHGMTGTALVEMPAEVGIAKLLGMKMIRLKDRNDLKKKAAIFLKELREGTIVYVHIKGPDEFGHDGDAVGKKKSVETIDKDFFSAAVGEIDETTIAVSCDHATPCTIKMHSSDPVPLLVTSKKGHDGLRFTEKNAKRGSLGRVYGRDVLDLVTKGR